LSVVGNVRHLVAVRGSDPRALLSLHEVADALGVSARTVARLTASGDLTSVRVGRRRLVRVADLADYVAHL
jgi:excisionase family DNA binding protein